jgi:Lrp/AsnC family transcriptional regulator, regulator for asnA, asnC and gidA
VSQTKKIGEIDAKILKDLLIDGRKEFTQIAREAQVSKDVIWQHYNNMKKEGIIVGATIQLNYAALGYKVSASFFVDVQPLEQTKVAEQLRKLPGLYDAYRWGSHSRLWAVSDMMRTEEIDKVKQAIKRLPSVLKTEVEIWTGSRNMPENLSILNFGKMPSDIEKTQMRARNRIKESEKEIDEKDKQIIEKLALNGRAPFSVIGKELGISTSTVIRRYNDLKRNGVVRALIQINPVKIGYPTMACFRLAVNNQGNTDIIAERISKIPDVTGIFKTTGVYDLTIFAEIRDLEHFTSLETEIANVPGIREMDTASLNRFSPLPYPREHISTF